MRIAPAFRKAVISGLNITGRSSHTTFCEELAPLPHAQMQFLSRYTNVCVHIRMSGWPVSRFRQQKECSFILFCPSWSCTTICCIIRFYSLCKNLFNLLEFSAEAFRCHVHLDFLYEPICCPLLLNPVEGSRLALTRNLNSQQPFMGWQWRFWSFKALTNYSSKWYVVLQINPYNKS